MPIKYEPLLIGLAMITMGSTLTALLKPQINLWQTLKNWIAGIIAGVMVMIFCMKNNYNGLWCDMVMISLSTFITSIYPIAEKFAKLYFIDFITNFFSFLSKANNSAKEEREKIEKEKN